MESFFKGKKKEAVKVATEEVSPEPEVEEPAKKVVVSSEILNSATLESDEHEHLDNPMENATVEVVSEDGTAKKLIITCSCGKQLVIRCEY